MMIKQGPATIGTKAKENKSNDVFTFFLSTEFAKFARGRQRKAHTSVLSIKSILDTNYGFAAHKYLYTYFDGSNNNEAFLLYCNVLLATHEAYVDVVMSLIKTIMAKKTTTVDYTGIGGIREK